MAYSRERKRASRRTTVSVTPVRRPMAGEPGWVYVMTNPAMPGLVKVGRTARNPSDRAKELRTTGVPGRFKVIHESRAHDAVLAEGLAHHALERYRVANDREFFQVSPSKAAAAVMRACGHRRRLPSWVWMILLIGLFVLAAKLNGKF